MSLAMLGLELRVAKLSTWFLVSRYGVILGLALINLLSFSGVEAAIINYESISGSAQGTSIPRFSQPGIPVLSSFHFDFSEEDHHIKKIQLLPDLKTRQLQVAFHDKNGDDLYTYQASYEMIQDPRLTVKTLQGHCGGGQCHQQIPEVFWEDRVGSGPNGTFAIVGFSATFDSDDHHLSKIGFHIYRQELAIDFRDNHTDTSFDWRLDYVMIPSDLLSGSGYAGMSRISGSGVSVIGRGVSQARPPVLSSFSMSYSDFNDHHLDEIGLVFQNGNSVRASFNDKNNDDTFHFSADYALLKSLKGPIAPVPMVPPITKFELLE